MDKNYTKAENIINTAASEIRMIIETTDSDSPKDREVNELLESIVKKLEDAERDIQSVASSTWEDILIQRSNGQLKGANSVFERTRSSRIKSWDIPGGLR